MAHGYYRTLQALRQHKQPSVEYLMTAKDPGVTQQLAAESESHPQAQATTPAVSVSLCADSPLTHRRMK